MRKKFLYLIMLILFFAPILCQADEDIFKAKVIEIIETQETTREDGSKSVQQNIKLQGQEGEWQDKEFTFYGISEIDVLKQNIYQKSDKVIVYHTKDVDGNDQFFITDYVRTSKILLLAIIFALLVIVVGRWKGLRALISLLITFAIILKFILPKILAGSNPLLIVIIGAVFILICIIYLTEGWNRRSHIALASIVISLIVTGLFSIIFTSLTRLTGAAHEEAMYLIGIAGSAINFKGLLLAGIIIGTLGVLDDMVISQVVAVEQIKLTNSEIGRKELFKKSYAIGVSHISSMTNTLFLAYAGASLPLLLLFSVKQTPFLTFNQVINNEMIATEIVRTLTGSVGLVLAVPIATFLAVNFIKAKTDKRPTKN